MNNAGSYFPKEVPFFFVLRRQNTIAFVYALIQLALVAIAIVGVPYGKQTLRNFLVVTTIYLNLRFDAESFDIAKMNPYMLDNIVMIIGVIAGLHFMEAKELSNQEKFARRAKIITLAQIAKALKKGGKENMFVTP